MDYIGTKATQYIAVIKAMKRTIILAPSRRPTCILISNKKMMVRACGSHYSNIQISILRASRIMHRNSDLPQMEYSASELDMLFSPPPNHTRKKELQLT